MNICIKFTHMAEMLTNSFQSSIVLMFVNIIYYKLYLF